MSPPETCSNCGSDVPRNARACPECGSCPATGWSKEAETAELGLPDDSFDYEAFTRKEFGGAGSATQARRWVAWTAAGLLLAALLIILLR